MVDFLARTRGYFFLARPCLKVGQDITRVREEDIEDAGLILKIQQAMGSLGVRAYGAELLAEDNFR